MSISSENAHHVHDSGIGTGSEGNYSWDSSETIWSG